MTWMAIGFCILVGVILASAGFLLLMAYVERRSARVDAMKRAILDKMEKTEGGS